MKTYSKLDMHMNRDGTWDVTVGREWIMDGASARRLANLGCAILHSVHRRMPVEDWKKILANLIQCDVAPWLDEEAP